MVKNLPTKQIFNTLNNLKQQIGLSVSDFIDNQSVRDKAIRNMEIRFTEINDIIESYFECKRVLNIE